MEDWKILHGEVLKDFVLYLNKNTKNYILKGGTSLMLCYDLTRFSEDIDLDALNTKAGIEPIVKKFCIARGYTYRVAKNTDTVKRYMIHYGGKKPVKVEISYIKQGNIQPTAYTEINGILVYGITQILSQKISAYYGRDRLRDLFDIVFIAKNYWIYIPESHRELLVEALYYKGLEHFDYIIREQSDELIDKDVLAGDFLELFDKLGLM